MFLCLFVASFCNTLTFSHSKLIEPNTALNPYFTSDWIDSIPPETTGCSVGYCLEQQMTQMAQSWLSHWAPKTTPQISASIHLPHHYQIFSKQNGGPIFIDLLQPLCPGVFSIDCDWILAPSKHLVTGLDLTPPGLQQRLIREGRGSELWCHNSRIIDSQCSLDLEAMSIKCLPLPLRANSSHSYHCLHSPQC